MKIVNNGTRQEWNIRSNETGVYSLPSVPAGQYDVTVAVTGFQTHLEKGVPVAANNTVRVDVGLKVGAVAETIAVSAAAIVLQTDSADVRAEIKGAELDSTPVPFTRNYQSLLSAR